MLQVNSNFEAVKTEMKQKTDRIKDSIKNLKRMQKETKKGPQSSEKIIKYQKDIDLLENEKRFYNASSVLPVKVGTLVINYKIYEKYIKALKGVQLEELAGYDSFKVSHQTGYIELIDLSDKFDGFQNIPFAEVI